MTILLVQTFLLMLGAFLLGASLACLIRRGFSGGDTVETATATAAGLSAAPAGASPTDADRFGRALSGGHGPSVPPVFQPGQPVVEVQPRPASAPTSEPVAFQPAPAPQPEPVPQPIPHHEPVTAPPQRDVLPPEPAAAPAPEPSHAPQPEPSPTTPAEESYTQIAIAAAAAATALKAKADAEAQAAAEREAAEIEEAPAEPELSAAQADVNEPSYTEIAAAAAAAATAAAAAALAEAEEASADTETSRFGTDVEPTPFEHTSDAPVDDLTRIHGIDIDIKERLIRYGVHRFSQIAAWTSDDVRGVNQSLGFQGRVERENWVEQASILAAGGDPGPSYKTAPSVPVETTAPVDGDRLHRIIGVDPQSEELLRANGVTQLAQIAAWSTADVAHFEELLGITGRVTREGWVEQALFLTGNAPPSAEETYEAEPETETESQDSAPPRSESYAALRSVRSEALRGDGLSPVAAGSVDDLKRIRGIGVLIEKKLNSLGITAYEQVANWTRADIDRISEVLDFKGRIERENWIEQARILASGGQTEFSRRADRGDV